MTEWSWFQTPGRELLPLENHSSKHSREKGGSEGGREERWGKVRGRREERKKRETVVECEKQRQVLPPPTSSNPPAATNHSTAYLLDTVQLSAAMTV